MIIGGLSLNAIGIWLAWSMKQLWILHDPDRSLVAGACGFGDAEYDPELFDDLEEVEEDTDLVEDTF